MPLPALVAANLGLRREWARILTYAIAGGSGVIGLLLALSDLLTLAAAQTPANAAAARATLPLLVSSAAALACLLPQARVAIARAIPIDPESPVHLLALALTLVLVGLQLRGAFSNAISQVASSGPPLSQVDLVAQELPFLLAALAGAGLWVRRSPVATLERLGVVRPAWWHLVLALAAAGAFYALAAGLDALGQALTPGTAREVNSATNRIFGQLLVDPAGIATIAIAAGLCEEVFFRGALQPRLGIVWTSLVFASVHTQYGLSFDALAVLILAGGLGLIRKYLNTTSSIVCHTAYDALTGVGLGAAGIAAGLAVEAVLVVVLGATFALRLRRLHPRPAS